MQQQYREQQLQQQPSAEDAAMNSPNAGKYGVPAAPAPRMFGIDVLRKVQQMQQQLALVNSTPALGLLEAAELLVHRLDVSLVRCAADFRCIAADFTASRGVSRFRTTFILLQSSS